MRTQSVCPVLQSGDENRHYVHECGLLCTFCRPFAGLHQFCKLWCIDCHSTGELWLPVKVRSKNSCKTKEKALIVLKVETGVLLIIAVR